MRTFFKMEPGELGIALAHKLIAALTFPFSKFNARMRADHEDPTDSNLTPNSQQTMGQIIWYRTSDRSYSILECILL